ncbi:hypothetical protein EV1_021320 [Malus domestica]
MLSRRYVGKQLTSAKKLVEVDSGSTQISVPELPRTSIAEHQDLDDGGDATHCPAPQSSSTPQTQSSDSKPLIEDFDLALNTDDRCFLVGSNGAGKTTILKILGDKHNSSNSNVSRIKIGVSKRGLVHGIVLLLLEVWDPRAPALPPSLAGLAPNISLAPGNGFAPCLDQGPLVLKNDFKVFLGRVRSTTSSNMKRHHHEGTVTFGKLRQHHQETTISLHN